MKGGGRKQAAAREEPAPTPLSSPRPAGLALAAVLLVLATLGAYLPVLEAGFVNYDDPHYVPDNRRVASGLSADNARWALTTFHTGYWHPATWLSLQLDCTLFGPRPERLHAVSLALHLASVVLLLVLLVRATGHLGRSALVAGLFALHPLNVESVAWIAERKNVLSTLVWLLALAAYAAWARRGGAARYLLLAALFVLGFAAKPMVVTLPATLVLLDLWPLARLSPARPRAQLAARLLEKLPLFALSAAGAALTIVAQRQEGAVASLEAVPLPARVGNALLSYVAYLGAMAWPAGLAVFYPHRGASLPWLSVLAAAAFLLALTAVAWRGRERRPWLLAGWLWYLGTLLPVSGLIQAGAQAMADRYAYVPLLGVFVAVAWGGTELAERLPAGLRRAPAAAAVAALAGCAAVTHAQARHWHDSVALFTHALAVTERNHLAHLNLGQVYAEQKRWPEAIRELSASVRLQPQDVDAQANLAAALMQTGHPEEAIPHLEAALRVNPEAVAAHNNLGVLELRRGRFAEAAEHFRRVLRVEPESVGARTNLGLALLQAGAVEEAQRSFTEALRLDERQRLIIARALLQRGRPQEAADLVRAAPPAQAATPEARALLGDALTNMGVALARAGKDEEALGSFRQAVEAAPFSVIARNNLGAALLSRRDLAGAVRELSESARLDPAHADTQANLGLAFLLSGDRERARTHLQRALELQPGHANAERYLREVPR